jgi:hypothetical protein
LKVFEHGKLRRIFGPRRRRWREAGEDFIMRSFITVRFTRHYQGDQVKEDEVGGARIMRGRHEK